jgi:hypothetical protein
MSPVFVAVRQGDESAPNARIVPGVERRRSFASANPFLLIDSSRLRV